MEVKLVPLQQLSLDPKNARKHNQRNLDAIAESLKVFGQRKPIVVHNGTVIAGNGTLEAAKSLGWKEISVAEVPNDWTEDMATAFALADNRTAELAEWDEAVLATQLLELIDAGMDIADLGFDEKDLTDNTDPYADRDPNAPGLADRFVVSPFTILDQKSAAWLERKRKWLATGIESELGRSNKLLMGDGQAALNKLTGANMSGTSIFDPVLCEIAYRWFSPIGGNVLDPFAGGSVRGFVAGHLNRNYTGIELRAEQVKANNEQWAMQEASGNVQWVTGDSNAVLDTLDYKADLIFSCPPYADLEVYSDDPADISNMPYEQFLEIYRSIITKACTLLENDSFAVWVVGDVRDKKGIYRGLVPDTIRAFEDAGLGFYNDGIIAGPIGTWAIRAGKQFAATRKLGKLHQNMLIFIKGDPRKATEKCGIVDVELPEAMGEDEHFE